MNHSVLIVDDDVEMRLLLRTVLVRKGFTVAGAGSGEEALKQIEEDRPDVVVLDVMMPGISGLEVCRALREAETTADLPVIMLSARTSLDAIADGLAAGATEYLTKPISSKELAQVICEVLHAPSQSANGTGRR